MTNRERFYQLRDQRTVEYISCNIPSVPLHVAIDTATAQSKAGQHVLLSLANMLARIHRVVSFDVPADPPVMISSPFGGVSLHDALMATVTAIDPYGSFRIGGPQEDCSVSVGIGIGAGRDCDWYLGAEQSIALLQPYPVPVDGQCMGTMRGAALAACLGAAAALKAVLGLSVVGRRISIWNYRENEEADIGPAGLSPVDVGSTLMIGAGAVASSLVYWLQAWGVGGQWTVVDPDSVQVHNTNRGLLFTPRDAGWPNYEPICKANRLAQFLPNATALTHWYDEIKDQIGLSFDTVLGLANERRVRTGLAHRNAPVILHATTGNNWLSQLHRHVSGVDDCIECRMGHFSDLRLQCSTGSVVQQQESTSGDMALPFLSGAAGLMLATALQRLQCGVLLSDERNDWRFDFRSTERMASGSKHTCREGCAVLWPSEIRKKTYESTRWVDLDAV